MNQVQRISIRTAGLSLPPAANADDADKENTALVSSRPARMTKQLVDWASTAMPDSVGKNNKEAASVGSNAIDRLRITHGAQSQGLSLALMRAQWWLATFAELAAVHALEFAAPHVTASQDDEVVLEWWRGERKLTVYVTSSAIEYVRVWGTDMFDEMDDGEVAPGTDPSSIWRWLVNGA
jgi:hypothetical protein